MSTDVFTFLTRSGCHLCDDVRPTVMKVFPIGGAVVREVDVDTDDDLLGSFGSRIPVVITPDGQVLVEGHITRKRLKRALKARRHLGS